jgi:hypothetical protein
MARTFSAHRKGPTAFERAKTKVEVAEAEKAKVENNLRAVVVQLQRLHAANQWQGLHIEALVRQREFWRQRCHREMAKGRRWRRLRTRARWILRLIGRELLWTKTTPRAGQWESGT